MATQPKDQDNPDLVRVQQELREGLAECRQLVRNTRGVLERQRRRGRAERKP